MEVLLITLAAGAILGGVLLYRRFVPRVLIPKTMERAARELERTGFAWDSPLRADLTSGLLRGGKDGMPVRISMELTPRGVVTRACVEGTDPALAFRRETLREKLGMTRERWITPSAETQWAQTNDVLTGDEAFDALIDIKGPIPACMAALDPETRDLVALVVEEWDGKVCGGEVLVESFKDLTVPGRLEVWVRTIHALAMSLRAQPPGNIKARLIQNYRREKNVYVRATLLGTLGSAFPGDAEMLALSREALADTSYDWIPMNGAANLGAEGIPAYRAILADAQQRDSIHAMCVRHLGFLLQNDEAESFLLMHLQDPRSAVACASAAVLGERAGTARAVPLLTETADHHASADVRKAAQKALDSIAVKLEGVEPGGLALASTGEDGKLSRADAAQPPLRDSSSERTGER